MVARNIAGHREFSTPCFGKNPPPPTRNILHAWEYPQHAWQRILLDILGTFSSKLFLTIVDANTKWLEAEEVKSMSEHQTNCKLRQIMAQSKVETDNGPPFPSFEFSQFMGLNRT